MTDSTRVKYERQGEEVTLKNEKNQEPEKKQPVKVRGDH